MTNLDQACIDLLIRLISIPSYSGQERETAHQLEKALQQYGVRLFRKYNNVVAYPPKFDERKPTVLLNSHHDTVKPGLTWTRDPHLPEFQEGRLFGLGSNDAGGALVSLLGVFLSFIDRGLPFNIIFAATAEEETSGPQGVTAILPDLPEILVGIVGEPTQMKMAIAEKGLLVIDGKSTGESGHVAHGKGRNAIYEAVKDIAVIRSLQFDRISDLLGATTVHITQIQAGSHHNVIPDSCNFVIDVRTNELYTNEEVLHILQSKTGSQLTARSLRLNSSSIDPLHPMVRSAANCGIELFGSSTLSDQSLMPFPTVKIGPGNSLRSHTANEYIEIAEIREGIETYIRLLNEYARTF